MRWTVAKIFAAALTMGLLSSVGCAEKRFPTSASATSTPAETVGLMPTAGALADWEMQRGDVAVQQKPLSAGEQLASARGLLAKGSIDEAARQLEPLLAQANLAEPLAMMGAIYEHRRQAPQAIAAYRRAIALDKQCAAAWRGLGTLLLKERHFAAAASHLQQALALQPQDALTHNNLGLVRQSQGLDAEAAQHFRDALTARSGFLPAANNLAWMLATHPDASLRDGAQAVSWAEEVCRAAGRKDPQALDTLAAAYAECGRFADALGAIAEALQLAGATPLAEELALRKQVYASERPYRDLRYLKQRETASFSAKPAETDPLLAGLIAQAEANGQGTKLRRLALLLAAHGDPAVRDSGCALQFAQAACRTDAGDARALSTLAAAEACGWQFDRACEILSRAKQRIDILRDQELQQQLDLQLEAYRQETLWLPAAESLPGVDSYRVLSTREKVARALHLLAVEDSRLGDAVAARESVEQALQFDPQLLAAVRLAAQLALAADDLSAAVDRLQAAVARQPDDAATLNNLGLTLERLGQMSGAVVAYADAMKYQPLWAVPVNNLAWLLATSREEAWRDGASAVALAEHAGRLAENDAASWDTLAAALAEAGDFQRAVEAAGEAVRLAEAAGSVKRAAAFEQRAEAYRQGQPWRLAQTAEVEKRFAPGTAMSAEELQAFHRHVGTVLLRIGREEQALRQFTAALQTGVVDAVTQNNLGLVLQSRGQHEEAAAAFRQALELERDWLPALNNLAWLLATSSQKTVREPALAVKLAERLCARAATGSHLDTLATAQLAVGQRVNAERTWRLAREAAEAKGDAGRAEVIEEKLEKLSGA